jgi:hypothetical protein
MISTSDAKDLFALPDAMAAQLNDRPQACGATRHG